MLWFHPIFSALVLLLALYVLALGWVRFRVNHLGGRGVFPWKRHVLLGKVVYAAWTLSFLGGAAMVRIHWPAFFLKGAHTMGGFVMLALMGIGLVTGLIMDRQKAKRRALPLLHALVNVLLLATAGYQAWTGWNIVQKVLLH
ncbi:hypothetical protein SAMN02745704_01658 [Paucidesulfovibrio gracilis DSM 16080]|uniref:DUF4079 domain-containing protein n=1 Tax=Paucidesulfovibrio gracilis DSM 16080 TaxID=1121449 RepID=A0A1T4X2X6_9BACT|nr:DUF4079 family protein [Paucidesulfovibrio gracilis]SKA83518.1 hypothetical protein SAMN02745704_01658 [Paucidesulfovibrio gracilis DSM 16080]